MATAAGVSRGKIRYWIEKAADPNFHPGVHGGFRGTPRLPAVVRCFLENLVFLLLEEAPSLRLPQLTGAINRLLQRANIAPITKTYLHALLQKYNYTYHSFERRKIEKFTAENKAYYLNYVAWALGVSRQRIVYCDESHFTTANLLPRQGYNVANVRRVVNQVDERHGPRLSMLLMVADKAIPTYVTLVSDTVNQWSFFWYCLSAVRAGFLQPGDVLVYDNAKIHCGAETFPLLVAVFRTINITIKLLPTYSPELNPCEFVQAFIKNELPYGLQPGTLAERIQHTAARVTRECVRNIINHVITENWLRV